MRVIWVLMIIFLVSIITGCGQRCDEPYKLIGNLCCIDDDNSGVCDLEEFEATMAEKPNQTIEPKTDTIIAVQKEPEPTPEVIPKQEPEAPTEKPAVTKTNQDQLPDRIHSLVPSIEQEKETVQEDVLTRPTDIDFKLTNLKHGYGKLWNIDVVIKNNMDFEVSPRIQVYALQDGEYKKVAEMLYKSLDPRRTRTVYQDDIGADIDEENTEAVFETLYYSTKTGLVNVGEIKIPLE